MVHQAENDEMDDEIEEAVFWEIRLSAASVLPRRNVVHKQGTG